MKALVTGGMGFIGSTLSRALVDDGAEVVILDNLSSGPRRRVASARVCVDDVRDLRAVEAACDGVEVVFHQAALSSVPVSLADPQLAIDCNVTGTLNVLRAATAAGVRRVILASSCSVYGTSQHEVQSETDATSPISPYAASKLSAEHFCRSWTYLYDLETICLRYFNVFGPGQDPNSEYGALLPAFTRALLEGTTPIVHGDGEQSRDLVFVGDVVRANIAAAARGIPGSVLNIGSGQETTVNQVLAAVADAVGTWIEPEHTEPRAGDIRRTLADVSRAQQALGWRAEMPFREAVNATVDWFDRVVGIGGPRDRARDPVLSTI